jgi:acetyl-CoA carboxylase biotin carboxyl carrier protein
MQLTLKQLKSLIATLEDGGATEFEYQDDKYRVRVALGRTSAAPAQVSAPPQSAHPPPVQVSTAEIPREAADSNVVFVTSPFVGTFYRSASPEAEPYVELGRAVQKGQTLCIVEAMKLMNEIEAEFAGTILEILAENGDSVEFGQRLFKIKKG